MIRFGTGGWRAEIGSEFIKSNICLVGQGVCELMKKENKTDKPVIIGYDRRFLSEEAGKWLAEVLAGNGISVIFLHRSAPTPLVMHTVKNQNLYFGLEVTASHNPPIYNGIKLIVEEGRDADVDITNLLEQLIESVVEPKSIPFSEGVEKGLITYWENPFNDFLDDILGVLDVDAIRKRGLRILFDPMHGSATYPLMTIFYTARCTLDLIHSDKDAYFGGMMPAPTQSTLRDLSKQVVDGGYDLGIGVDGDGDRLGIIDYNGTYISANQILVLLYYYLHEYKGWKGPVVRNLATTHMLDVLAEDLGEKCYEVPVGFKYISSKIDEVDAVLGGESSGGLTVRGHIHGKDSVYAASLFAEMICKTGKSPSELFAELEEKYGKFEMVEFNLPFAPEAKDDVVNKVMVERILPDFEQKIAKVSYEDGCKVHFEDNSFVICRFSGTEPLLRIFAEGKSKEQAQGYINAWKALLKL
ncbi:MAG: phosphoglucomutase/phosphomannomutase family protein [Clostridia bacterium]|nr:phosphoglucomutase/phosphomannomutase family protein [Clostridia bacterium]